MLAPSLDTERRHSPFRKVVSALHSRNLEGSRTVAMVESPCCSLLLSMEVLSQATVVLVLQAFTGGSSGQFQALGLGFTPKAKRSRCLRLGLDLHRRSGRKMELGAIGIPQVWAEGICDSICSP